jgi:hypothetical protein
VSTELAWTGPAGERHKQNGVAAGVSGPPPHEPAEVEASIPQQLMWLHHELVQVPVYNEPIVIQHHGSLQIQALHDAFAHVVDRHEAWRTGFEWKDSLLVQRVWPSAPVSIPVVDVEGLPPEQREERVLREIRLDLGQNFDLSRPPLFRLRLFRFSPSEYRLYLTIHHIIVDGVSMGQVFLKELAAAYQAFAEGKTPSLPALPMQYRDYAAALPTRTNAGTANQALAYWTEKLSGPLPSTTLPLDKDRPETRSYAGDIVPFSLDGETTKALKDLARRSHASLPMILLAACHVALYRETGETDQIVGTVTSDRKQPGTRNLLGLFLNTVVLRTSFQPEDTFLSLLGRVRETMLDAMSHDVIPFSELVNRFERDRLPGKSPLFQIMYAPQPAQQRVGTEWELSQMAVPTGLSKFDLNLEIDSGGDQVWGRIHFSTELFTRDTVLRFKNNWQAVLSLASTKSDLSVSELIHSLPAHASEKKSKSMWQRLLRK